MTISGSFEHMTPVAYEPRVEESEIFMDSDEPTINLDLLVEHMISYTSYLNQLYLQTHLVHLNVEGPLFLQIHKFLRKQYEKHIEQFDTLSEFVRSLDYLMPVDAKQLHQACKNFKNVKSYDTREMLTVYVKNLEDAGMRAKDLSKVAGHADAVDVENYLQELVGIMFKDAWFIKATLRD